MIIMHIFNYIFFNNNLKAEAASYSKLFWKSAKPIHVKQIELNIEDENINTEYRLQNVQNTVANTQSSLVDGPKLSYGNSSTIVIIVTILYILIITGAWIFIIIMINDIYLKYEDNLHKITLSSFVITLLIFFFILHNLIILISTAFVCSLGKLSNSKTELELPGIITIITPPYVSAQYTIILNYRNTNRLERYLEKDQN